MTHLYNFGISQEDERTEAAALDLQPTDRVLCVASAGDMPLSLLALGAGEVHAVDVDPHQLELTRLKLAAVCALPRQDAARFLGFRPAPAGQRLAWLDVVTAALAPASAAFWRTHRAEVAAGAIWAGRFERYVRRLAPLLLALVGPGRVRAFFDAATLDQQRRRFDASFGRRRVRALFKLAFHPAVFRRRGMDPRSLSHRDAARSLGDQYFDQLRQMGTATPAADNPLFQLMLLGHTLGADVVPAYLSAPGAARVRARCAHVHLHQADLADWLEAAPPDAFDKVHLSNVPDWLDAAAFARVLRLVCARARRPARVVWRFIHVDRPVPDDLRGVLTVDAEAGRRLAAQDRFPFYGVVPASIGPDGESPA